MKKLFTLVIVFFSISLVFSQTIKSTKIKEGTNQKAATAVAGTWTWTVMDTISTKAGGSYQTVYQWSWVGNSLDTPKTQKNTSGLKFTASK